VRESFHPSTAGESVVAVRPGAGGVHLSPDAYPAGLTPDPDAAITAEAAHAFARVPPMPPDERGKPYDWQVANAYAASAEAAWASPAFTQLRDAHGGDGERWRDVMNRLTVAIERERERLADAAPKPPPPPAPKPVAGPTPEPTEGLTPGVFLTEPDALAV
jgi:hypothetical protein